MVELPTQRTSMNEAEPFPARERQTAKKLQAEAERWLKGCTSFKDAASLKATDWMPAALEVVSKGLKTPIAVLYDIDKAAHARIDVTGWFKRQGVTEQQEATLSHEYLNEELKAVFRLLKDDHSHVPYPTDTHGGASASTVNLYEALCDWREMEQTVMESVDTLSIDMKPGPSKRKLARIEQQRPKHNPPELNRYCIELLVLDVIETEGSTLATMKNVPYLEDITPFFLVLFKANQVATHGLEDAVPIALDAIKAVIDMGVDVAKDSYSQGPTFSQELVPEILGGRSYRQVADRVLAEIMNVGPLTCSSRVERANEEAIYKRVPGILYTARAIRGVGSVLTAAVMLSVLVDTTHLGLWARGGKPVFPREPRIHLIGWYLKTLASFGNPKFAYSNILLAKRHERLLDGETEADHVLVLSGFHGSVVDRLSANATKPLDTMPAVVATETRVMYATYALALPVVLNNCQYLALNLIAYRLVLQLDMIKSIPILDVLVTLFAKKINIDNRVGHYSSAWNALLGGKVTKDSDGRYKVTKVSSYSTCPDRLTIHFSTLLAYGNTPDLADDKSYRAKVIPETLGTVESSKDKKELLSKFSPEHYMLGSFRTSVDIRSALLGCKGDIPPSLVDYLDVYNTSMALLDDFHVKITPRRDIFSSPQPSLDSGTDGAYMGIADVSGLLERAEQLLRVGGRKAVLRDKQVKALASSFQEVWGGKCSREFLLW